MISSSSRDSRLAALPAPRSRGARRPRARRASAGRRRTARPPARRERRAAPPGSGSRGPCVARHLERDPRALRARRVGPVHDAGVGVAGLDRGEGRADVQRRHDARRERLPEAEALQPGAGVDAGRHRLRVGERDRLERGEVARAADARRRVARARRRRACSRAGRSAPPRARGLPARARPSAPCRPRRTRRPARPRGSGARGRSRPRS